MFKMTLAALVVLAAGSASAQFVSDAGVTVLNASREGATTVSGQASVHSRRIAVASSHRDAIVVNGQGRIQCSDVRIAGGYELSGRQAQIMGAIYTGADIEGDPMADRAGPINEMAAQFGAENNQAESQDLGAIKINGGDHTLEPGFYSGGMDVSGGNVTMNPGVYILGAGVSIAGQSNIVAEGVCIVILEGDMKLAGGAGFRIEPPVSGDYADMSLVMPDDNDGNISFSGGSELSIQGAIYAPSGSMSVTGHAAAIADAPFVGEIVIVDTLSLAGRGSIIIGAMGPVNLITEPKID